MRCCDWGVLACLSPACCPQGLEAMPLTVSLCHASHSTLPDENGRQRNDAEADADGQPFILYLLYMPNPGRLRNPTKKKLPLRPGQTSVPRRGGKANSNRFRLSRPIGLPSRQSSNLEPPRVPVGCLLCCELPRAIDRRYAVPSTFQDQDKLNFKVMEIVESRFTCLMRIA